MNQDGKILEVNQPWLETLGYERPTVVGSSFERFLTESSTEQFQSTFERFKREGRVDNIEFEMLTGTGDRIVVSFSGHSQYDDDGEFVKTHCQFKDITARVENEQQLLQYKQGIESSTNLIAAIEPDYSYLFANSSYKEFHSLASDTDISTLTVQDVIGKERFDRVKRHVDGALQGKRTELSIQRSSADGTTKVLNARYFPLRNAAGDVKGSVGVFQDITEKQERLQTIQELAEYRRVASAVNQQLVHLTNVRNELSTLANTIASSPLFECTFIYISGRVGQDIICSDKSELTAEKMELFHTDEYVDTVTEQGTVQMSDVTKPPYNQHPGGDVPSHKGVAIAITHDSAAYGILTVHLPPENDIDQEGVRLLEDIADNIGLELRSQDLERDREIFREIIERIEDPIMLQNLDGEYQIINRAVADHTGKDREELIGQDEDIFMDSETATTIRDMKNRVIDQNQTVQYQVSPNLPTSSSKTFSTVRYPYTNEIGEIVGTVAICRDITELKKRERQLEIFERVLRHNLRNSMNAIMAQAELLLTDPDRDTDVAAQKIIDVSESLVELTEKERELVALLRERQPPQQISICPLLRRTVRQVRDDYPDAVVNLDCPTDARIWAIPAIERGLHELVENGVKHSNGTPAAVEIAVSANGKTVEITIQDNGPGLPEMERQIISEHENISPLFHGSGLGIWLARYAISQSEGSLSFDGTSPDGSQVEITLPISDQ